MKKLKLLLLFLPLFAALVANVLLSSKMRKTIASYNSHLKDIENRELIEEVKCSYEELVASIKSMDKVNKANDVFDTKHSIKIMSLFKQLVIFTITMLIIQAIAIFAYLLKLKQPSN